MGLTLSNFFVLGYTSLDISQNFFSSIEKTITNIYIMNMKRHLFSLSLLALLASCANDVDVASPEVGESTISEIVVSAPSFGYDEFTSTRTDFVINSQGAGFQWSAKDTVGIFPDTGSQAYFPMEKGAGTSSAKFTGGGWGLQSASTYYAYYPFSRRYSLDDKTINKIPVSYMGQKQVGNSSTAGLGEFDFMAAAGSSSTGGSLNFQFEHLGTMAQITVTVPSAGTFTRLELMPSNLEFISTGYVDLTADVPAITGKTAMKKVTMDLSEISASSSGENLVFYMMLPPTNMQIQSLTLTLKKTDGTYSRGELTFNKQLVAGKAYQMKFANMQDVEMITNLQLIQAAENCIGSVFEKNADGTITLTAENREKIESVWDLTFENWAISDPNLLDEVSYFSNLEYLNIRKMGVYNVDLSNNVKLRDLWANENNFESLDFSNNPELRFLDIENCKKLSSINLPNQTKLLSMNASNHRLSSLDLSHCPNLTELYLGAYDNRDKVQLSTLDVSHNPLLTIVNCDNTNLKSLDVSNNPNLRSLACNDNLELTSLDVTNCPSLDELNAGATGITSLDLSHCPFIRELWLGNSHIGSLDLSNNLYLCVVHCYNNGMSSLILPNTVTLTDLYATDNEISTIDVSSNINLVRLYVCNNRMSELNVSGCTRLNLNNVTCGIQKDGQKMTLSVNETQYTQTLRGDCNDNVELVLASGDPGGSGSDMPWD